MSILQEEKYRLKEYLRRNQRGCPACGKSVRRQGDLHHWLVRRGPDIPELYHKYNMFLVCNTPCHVPESKDLNLKCARKALALYGPDNIESWLRSLPFKVTSLPDFYVRARDEYLRNQARVDTE